jgi:hypothetical protein
VITSLHAPVETLNLRALGETRQSVGIDMIFYYYLTDTAGNYLVDASAEQLTDPSGNRLTDTSGNYLTTTKNRLVAGVRETIFPLVLNAVQDDWNLNSE